MKAEKILTQDDLETFEWLVERARLLLKQRNYEGIDILLTHGPAKGILDQTVRGENVGCEDMVEALNRIQPNFVVCGHIHHSAGIKEVNNTTHINAAVLNDYYQHFNNFSPISFEL